MNLSEQLQHASDLAVLSDIITQLRKREELLPGQKEFLKNYLWPWWDWILHQEGGKEKRPHNWVSRPQLLVMLSKKGQIKESVDRVNALCRHVWLNTELPKELWDYLLEISIELRKVLLMDSSTRW